MFKVESQYKKDVIYAKNNHFRNVALILLTCSSLFLLLAAICYKQYTFNCSFNSDTYNCGIIEKQFLLSKNQVYVKDIYFFKTERHPKFSSYYQLFGIKKNKEIIMVLSLTSFNDFLEGKIALHKELAQKSGTNQFSFQLVEYLYFFPYAILVSLIFFILSTRLLYKYIRSFNFIIEDDTFKFYSITTSEKIEIPMNKIKKIELFTKDGSSINSNAIKRYKKVNSNFLYLLDYYLIGIEIEFLFIDINNNNYSFVVHAPEIVDCYEFYSFLQSKIKQVDSLNQTTLNINKLLNEMKDKKEQRKTKT